MDNKGHAHRWTLPNSGQQVVSSVDRGNPHAHSVVGNVSSRAPEGSDHTHTVEMAGVPVESGPPIEPWEIGLQNSEISKGIMPELVDPNHTYVYSTGAYGIKDYWYVDLKGNYWRYTNAPEDHEDFDPYAGVPLLVHSQPMPTTAPQFFTEEGLKRHIAVPPGLTPDKNPDYSPIDPANIWYEVFSNNGSYRYVYLDSDVRENIDLWIQYRLRVTDASIPRLRSFASSVFQKTHPKDRLIGAILMLIDQGMYDLEELIEASVGDLEFIDETVKLLGRKFRCDHTFFDFLTSLVVGREKESVLFQWSTTHGKSLIGPNYLYSLLHHFNISPSMLLSWHASNMFSRIASRLALEEVPEEEIEGRAFSELQRTLVTNQDIKYLIDYKVRSSILNNYGVSKSLDRGVTDEFGTLMLFSDLIDLKAYESEFSEWLHDEPLHTVTPNTAVKVEDMLSDEEASDGQEGPGEYEGLTDAEGQDVGETDAGGEDAGTTDTEEAS